MTVKLLTECHLVFLSLKGGCRGSSEARLVKMSNCWKSHAAAQMIKTEFLLYRQDWFIMKQTESEMFNIDRTDLFPIIL